MAGTGEEFNETTVRRWIVQGMEDSNRSFNDRASQLMAQMTGQVEGAQRDFEQVREQAVKVSLLHDQLVDHINAETVRSNKVVADLQQAHTTAQSEHQRLVGHIDAKTLETNEANANLDKIKNSVDQQFEAVKAQMPATEEFQAQMKNLALSLQGQVVTSAAQANDQVNNLIVGQPLDWRASWQISSARPSQAKHRAHSRSSST